MSKLAEYVDRCVLATPSATTRPVGGHLPHGHRLTSTHTAAVSTVRSSVRGRPPPCRRFGAAGIRHFRDQPGGTSISDVIIRSPGVAGGADRRPPTISEGNSIASSASSTRARKRPPHPTRSPDRRPAAGLGQHLRHSRRPDRHSWPIALRCCRGGVREVDGAQEILGLLDGREQFDYEGVRGGGHQIRQAVPVSKRVGLVRIPTRWS